MVKVMTNNVPRPLLTWDELTDAEKKEFDLIDHPEDGLYVRYKGVVYGLDEFERTSIPEWDGVHPESYFSGVLIRLVPDGDEVVMGRYF